MTDETREESDALVDAVRRCWGGESAPDAVRQRVAVLVAAARVRRRGRLVRWAAVGVGVVGSVVGLGLLSRPATSPVPAAPLLAASLEQQLVQTHDQCSRRADHQRLAVPKGNGYAIAAAFRSQLDRPVLVGRPADDGWRFTGASVCPVGGVRAAHLVYRRADGDTLSVFSLPRSAAPTAVDGQQFQAQADGHVIAGFVRHGAIYCLVGSGCAQDVSPDRLAAVREQLERQVLVADAGPVAAGPGQELIHVAGR